MNSGSGLGFRPDIQGLRAIAVTIVILAHAGVPGFAGGFVGVDVFFVLSGFLITGLLVEERLATGKIAYAAFLARRLRRLLPALVVMAVGVLFFAAFLLSSYEAQMQTGSFPYVISWTSNFYFALVEFDYFAALRTKDLFLHTWSLGIEEQFYIVWPWLMMLAFVAGSRQAGRDDGRAFFLTGTVFLAGLGLCLYWAWKAPLLSFYMMPARGWQFALGAFIFLLTRRLEADHNDTEDKKQVVVGGMVGLTMIAAATSLLTDKLNYPGFYALAPSVGAALLLYSGSAGPAARTTHLLAARPLVWLGDRSYSFYLWHWPVLMLGGAYGLTNSSAGTVSLIAVTLLLATGSYQWVELPFWKGRFSDAQPRLVTLTAGLALSVAFLAGNVAGDLTQGRAPAVADSDADGIRNDIAETFDPGLGCDSWYHNAEITPCTSGAEDADRTVALIGDSIGTQWASVLPEIYRSPDWRIVVLAKSACTIADLEYYYKPAGGLYNVCTTWRERSLDYLAHLTPDVVFMGSSSTPDFTEAEWIQGTRSFVGKLAAVTDNVIIIPGTPALSFDGPSCLREPYRFASRLRDSQHFCEEPQKSDYPDRVAGYLASAVSDFSNAHILNLNDLVCPDGRCAARSREGIPVFRDSQHLTATFVVSQSAAVADRLAALGLAPENPDEPVTAAIVR